MFYTKGAYVYFVSLLPFRVLTCGLPLDVERSMAGRGSRGSLGVGLRGRCACAAAIFTDKLIAEKPGGTLGPIALTPPTPLPAS